MTERLCFLLTDIDRTRIVIEQLRDAGVSDANMMVVAMDDTPLGDLREASIDKTDFFPLSSVDSRQVVSSESSQASLSFGSLHSA